MPGQGSIFQNKIINGRPVEVNGQVADVESGVQVPPYQGAGFELMSGGSNGLVADVTYNQSSNVTLLADSRVPASKRCRLTALGLSVHGNVGWTGGSAVVIQDTAGYPAAYFPLIALGAMAQYRLPSSATNVALTATVSSYSSSTGVMTFPASTFINNTLANVPFRVVAGTGRGQTGIISANTTTTLTPATVPVTALDSTSVVEVGYYAASAATSTTVSASNAAWTSGALATGSWYVVVVAGTGAGQVRAITANTATQLTVATWGTTPDTTSVFQITNDPKSLGVVDLSIGQNFSSTTVGRGLQAALLGTFSGSTTSPIRVWGSGSYTN